MYCWISHEKACLYQLITGSAQKYRVGRVSGNTGFFFFWPNDLTLIHTVAHESLSQPPSGFEQLFIVD